MEKDRNLLLYQIKIYFIFLAMRLEMNSASLQWVKISLLYAVKKLPSSFLVF